MKICIISNLYPPFVIGGAEIMANRQADGLARRRHKVSVITTSPNGRSGCIEEVNGVRVHRISPLNLYQPYEYQQKPKIIKPLWHAIDLWNPHSHRLIKGILRNEKPDVVHINNYKGLSLAVFSAVKSLGIPLIFTAHDYSLICPRANLLKSSGQICSKSTKLCRLYTKIQEQLVEGKLDAVTAPSQFVIDKLKSSGLFAGVRAFKLPNALPLPRELNSVKAEKDYHQIDILYVGQVNKPKGVQVLINAFKGLNVANVRLHIQGRGQDVDEMKRLAGGNSKIVFHGFLSVEALVALYQTANVLVVPSIWYEPFGLVIIESFSFGTPVVGSRIGGIPEIIEEGYNGHLFEAGNSEELRSILERLINNSVELKRLEEGAFESSKKYDIEHHISRLEEIFTVLAKKS